MALHSKWSSGDLIFYDGTQTVFTIQDDSEGILFGEDDEGVDVKFFGDTTGAYILWDEDVDDLLFEGGAGLTLDGGDILLEDQDFLYFGDSKDMSMNWTTGSAFAVIPLVANADVDLGTATLPLKVKFFGTTGSTEYMQWSSTGGGLIFDQADIVLGDTDYIIFGDGSDFAMDCTTGNVLQIVPATSGSDMNFGSAAKPLDIVNYGNIRYRDPNTANTTGDITLTSGSNMIQFLTPTTGAVNLHCPNATGNPGLQFILFNNAGTTGYLLTVHDGATTGTAFAILDKNQGAIVISDGADWNSLVAGQSV